MQKYLRYGAISVVFIIVQTTIVPFVAITDIIPDILMVWIVYIAIRLGQIPATVAGFTIGLFMDLVSGQFIGLSALSKTAAGFVAGYFYNENKVDYTIGNYQFLIIVGITALLHNIIYFAIFVQGSEISLWTAILRFGILSTIYTTAIAVLPVFVFSRKLA